MFCNNSFNDSVVAVYLIKIYFICIFQCTICLYMSTMYDLSMPIYKAIPITDTIHVIVSVSNLAVTAPSVWASHRAALEGVEERDEKRRYKKVEKGWKERGGKGGNKIKK